MGVDDRARVVYRQMPLPMLQTLREAFLLDLSAAQEVLHRTSRNTIKGRIATGTIGFCSQRLAWIDEELTTRRVLLNG